MIVLVILFSLAVSQHMEEGIHYTSSGVGYYKFLDLN
jgi:hypothetical protein